MPTFRAIAPALASTVGCTTLDCPCRFGGRLSAQQVFDEEPTVCREAALREVRRHHAEEDEFFSDLGDKPEYDGAQVLAWLGY